MNVKVSIFIDGIKEFPFLGSGKMDSLSQPSWVLGFGSVRFVRSSFLVDMDGAEGKRYIFRCIYIYIFSIFSAAKQGFDLSFDGEIQLMLSIFCI